ncbi:tRNA lysidine(34) synthetase TilS [Kaistia defluvii]|uniref:tRNA lysidine(34) synthetase TilS n=1 Tax=Kaistia defluvii TaxID=410841 RepID=UPI002253AB28|nr:tRNA lysidine(34) synthetase TilS [Kaistia defluvii]MCX5517513.1 tRNA lysidine(34) synthetase TilS [Kaistia defluvii]
MPAADGSLLNDGARLDELFAPFAETRCLALAVSGGADSLALLLLAQRWRAARLSGPELLVLTVDHGLRPESSAEARFVGEVAKRHGLRFQSLLWQGPAPLSGVEAAARAARYALLLDAARQAGATHLATAHHRDDQAETFLMRLARGSGVYGLAAMARDVERDGIRLVRPLLDVPHEDLVAVVRAAGLQAVDDPHNADPAFDRVRFRRLMPIVAAEGLDAETLAATAKRLGRAAAALDSYVGRLFDRAAILDATGGVRLDAAAWCGEPEEVRLRALARILRAAGGAPYVPRLESLEALELAMRQALQDEPSGKLARTLAGVLVDLRQGAFRFQREPGREGLAEITVESGFVGIWDGRFAVRMTAEGEGAFTIGALGAGGRRQFAVCVPKGMPRAIEALPALRRNGEIIAVPGLGITAEASLGVGFEASSLVARRMLEPVRSGE